MVLFINEDASFQKISLHYNKGDLVFDVAEDGIDSLINFLNRLPKKYEQRLSPDLKTLYRAWHLSIKLAENGVVIPQILTTTKDKHVIRWIPAIINEEVSTLLNVIELGISPGLIKVSVSAKKKNICSYGNKQ